MPRPDPRSRAALLIALVVAALLLLYGNVVVGRAWWTARTLQGRGQLVSARLVSAGTAPGPRSIGQQYGVTYRLPASVDPAGLARHATVTRSAFEAARASGQVPVQVLPGRVDVQQVVGATGATAGAFWVLVFDVCFLGVLLVVLRPALGGR